MSALSPQGAAGADAVLDLFEALQDTDLEPNSITYVSAIRAYGDKGNWEKAEQVCIHGIRCVYLVLRSVCFGRRSGVMYSVRVLGMCFDRRLYRKRASGKRTCSAIIFWRVHDVQIVLSQG